MNNSTASLVYSEGWETPTTASLMTSNSHVFPKSALILLFHYGSIFVKGLIYANVLNYIIDFGLLF